MTEKSGSSHPVEIDAISVRYGTHVPLRHLSLAIGAGELVSLLGPSGCGKTTTLRAVAGFVTPFEGDVRIAGRSVTKVPANHRNIGMMYQSYALFPHMSVGENVAFGLRMRGEGTAERTRKAREILDKFQLGAMEDRLPSQLSGGQQQRVALARALVINPSVLLLDEPLAALDKKLRAEMQFELKRIQREYSITTMFVSHDQEEALSLSDRIAVMEGGRIRQIGTPEAIYDTPADRFVGDFIGSGNFLKGTARPDGDGVLVELAGLGATVRARPAAPVAGPVDVMVRPERLSVTVEDGAPDGPLLRGRVRERVFLGNLAKVEIEVGGGRMLRAEVPADRALAPGAAVAVSFQPHDLHVWPDDGAKA